VESVAATGAATVVMSYWNPIDRYGVDRFARDLASAGGVGVITADLIPDEADEWLSAARMHEIDTVFLVAPSSSDERIALTAQACRGFVYAASTMGVTGVRASVSTTAAALVQRTRIGSGPPPHWQQSWLPGFEVGNTVSRCREPQPVGGTGQGPRVA
jgi:tryptophan synthase alpha chain